MFVKMRQRVLKENAQKNGSTMLPLRLKFVDQPLYQYHSTDCTFTIKSTEGTVRYLYM